MDQGSGNKLNTTLYYNFWEHHHTQLIENPGVHLTSFSVTGDKDIDFAYRLNDHVDSPLFL
jgi:hypothetical protein